MIAELSSFVRNMPPVTRIMVVMCFFLLLAVRFGWLDVDYLGMLWTDTVGSFQVYRPVLLFLTGSQQPLEAFFDLYSLYLFLSLLEQLTFYGNRANYIYYLLGGLWLPILATSPLLTLWTWLGLGSTSFSSPSLKPLAGLLLGLAGSALLSASSVMYIDTFLAALLYTWLRQNKNTTINFYFIPMRAANLPIAGMVAKLYFHGFGTFWRMLVGCCVAYGYLCVATRLYGPLYYYLFPDKLPARLAWESRNQGRRVDSKFSSLSVDFNDRTTIPAPAWFSRMVFKLWPDSVKLSREAPQGQAREGRVPKKAPEGRFLGNGFVLGT